MPPSSPQPAPAPHLILLRTPLSPLPSDPYQLHLGPLLSSAEQQLTHLPILSTHYLPTNLLSHPLSQYPGIILSSARAVHSLSLALALALPSTPTEEWSRLPFFVVGQGTADALRRIMPQGRGEPEGGIWGAEESGTGERLARFVVRWFHSRSEGSEMVDGEGMRRAGEQEQGHEWQRKPLLWLVGDKNKPTIGRILLEEGGIPTHRVQVYETSVRPEFGAELEGTLRSAVPNAEEDGPREVWIALFSPSGAQPCLAHLRQLGLLPPPPSSSPSSPTPSPPPPADLHHRLRIRLAAIGPVTRDYLVDEEGMASEEIVMAKQPEPEGLWRAIEEVRWAETRRAGAGEGRGRSA